MKSPIDHDAMKTTYKTIPLFAALLMTASCSSDEPFGSDANDGAAGQITCTIEDGDNLPSRSHFEYDKNAKGYFGEWDANDKIAVFFDNDNKPHPFSLIDGAGKSSATFLGRVPENYTCINAVYPAEIFIDADNRKFSVNLPETVSSAQNGVLHNSMPMFGIGNGGALRFYNLMAAIKIPVTGNTILRKVTITSPDGLGLSGHGVITADDREFPCLKLEDSGKGITIDLGGILLCDTPSDIILPVPATDYPNGLRMEFETHGGKFTQDIPGPLTFSPSVIRPVKKYDIGESIDLNSYAVADNEILYFSYSKQSVSEDNKMYGEIISNSYSPNLKAGMIVTRSPINTITGKFFQTPDGITGLKLPNSIEEIGSFAFDHLSCEHIEFPKSLKSLGVDAFAHNTSLKEVILPEGFKSLGPGSFEDCTSIEKVFLPSSLDIISAYAFLYCTGKLSHWDGDCKLIDKDRHALYSNSSYGVIWESLNLVEAVAGCDLVEYTLPSQAINLQNYSLSGCGKLTTLIIPAGIQSLNYEPFPSSNSLRTIICHSTTPPYLEVGSTGIENVTEVLVPKGSAELYREAESWKIFASKIKEM